MAIVAGHAADVRYSLLVAKARRFESLTLKMKVKYVDDLDENRLAKVIFDRAYVCKNCYF